MAVIANKATEVGDVLYLKADVPVVGVALLSSFIDDTVGEDAGKFFNKRYRISFDNNNWSVWKDLTEQNLQSENIVSTDPVYFEYQYERAGADTTGDLEFNSVEISGALANILGQPHYDNSIFSSYFTSTDTRVLNWATNVLEKLYEKNTGHVPSYINREGRGFTDYYRPICEFFAYLVQLAREFQNFYDSDKILFQFLENRDVKLCGNEELSQLQYLSENIYYELAKRGTNQIFSTQGITLGEFMRLICFEEGDEFLAVNNQPKYVGWHLGHSSPMYRGNGHNPGYNKTYEQEFTDLDKWPTYYPEHLSISNGELIINSLPNGDFSGIGNGAFGNLPTDEQFLLPVDPNLTYEVSFWWKAQVASEPTMAFAVVSMDKDKNVVILPDFNGSFFINSGLPVADRYYYVRGLIFPYTSSPSGTKTSLGFGNNLRFHEDSRYIIPQIFVANQTGSANGEHHIKDVKISLSSSNYSKCFLGNKNLLEIYCKNNSSKYSNEQVKLISRSELFPVSTTSIINTI